MRGGVMNQRVHIEFQRVQTWLFAAPRLRAMVGANTLLGETLRKSLYDLALGGAGDWQLSSLQGNFPTACPDDPLKQDDNPHQDAEKGIVSRDGGHFEVFFSCGAARFAEAASALIRKELQGLRFRISIDNEKIVTESFGCSNELPVFSPCEWSGHGLASREVTQGDERAWVSHGIARRHEAAKRVEDGEACDTVSLLLNSTTSLKQYKRPKTLEDLTGSGYLAIIHADGNNVGKGLLQQNGTLDDAKRAKFFHRNRVLLRRATKKAIEGVCEFHEGQKQSNKFAPLLPLMLGGDDLLVLCQARTAFPFVIKLCKELEELQKDSPNFLLTLGIGVVFSRPTVPIYRLHEVVEQLASSAKRRFRGFSEGKCSVVDWAVYTTSWADSPEDIRRRDWIRGEGEDQRILSSRPLDVLGDDFRSLEGLYNKASKLDNAPRSQLRYLVEQLALGRFLSDLAFSELSTETKEALRGVGIGDGMGMVPIWKKLHDKPLWMTNFLDLVEIYEISRLGRSTTSKSDG
jgi:hypothetical protein